MYPQKVISKKTRRKFFFGWHREGQLRKEQDPEPDLLVRATYQNITDPEHCLKVRNPPPPPEWQLFLSRHSCPWPAWQRCGTVTIYYGSGSDCLKDMVPVPFRFQLLKSYGSGSYFWKVTVPVPAPYLDHKRQIFQKKFWKIFCLST
jgi:hypothetical protein